MVGCKNGEVDNGSGATQEVHHLVQVGLSRTGQDADTAASIVRSDRGQ